jgi:hypothetical protein
VDCIFGIVAHEGEMEAYRRRILRVLDLQVCFGEMLLDVMRCGSLFAGQRWDDVPRPARMYP